MSDPADRQSSPGRPARVDVRGDARAEEAARLLRAARAVKPAINVTLPEIQAAIRARRYGAMVPMGRLLAVAVIAVFPVVALGAVGVSRGWWAALQPRASTSVVVPAGATARIGRRGHFTLSLQGPAAVEVQGDDRPIAAGDGAPRDRERGRRRDRCARDGGPSGRDCSRIDGRD